MAIYGKIKRVVFMNSHVTNGRKGLSLSQVGLLFLLFYLFLAFPFFFRNIDTGFYSGIKYALILIVLMLGAIDRRGLQGFERLAFAARKHQWIIFFFCCYILYMLFLITASVMSKSNDSLVGVAYVVQVVMLAGWFAFALSDRALFRALDVYVKLMVLASITGILTAVLVHLKWIAPIGTVKLDNGSEREWYLTGFVWRGIWIGETLGLIRVQSFCDEAGTFGFALIPAILLAVQAGKWGRAAIMVFALIFSFSIGAMVSLGVAFLLMTKQSKMFKFLVTMTFVTAVGLIGIAVLHHLGVNNVSDFLSTYWSSKVTNTGNFLASDDNTSVGSRLNDLSVVLSAIKQNPWGFGVDTKELNIPLAVGWIVPLAQSGVVGWIFYLFSFAALILFAIKGSFSQHQTLRLLAVIVLVLAIAAFQRGAMDSTMWHWWWIIAYLRVYALSARNLPSGRQLLLQHKTHYLPMPVSSVQL